MATPKAFVTKLIPPPLLQGRGGRPKSRLGYQPELDGLRGIAIGMVLVGHVTGWPPGGYIGVDIFFTLSGFLITALLLDEWKKHQSISFRYFYARRALRLLPALIVILASYALLILLIPNQNRGLRLESIAYVSTYVSNWLMAVDHPVRHLEMAHLWSLAIEEQFYLLWPVAMGFALGRGITARGLRIGLAVVITGLAAWRIVLVFTGATWQRLYYSTDTRIDELLIGCLLAAIFLSRPSGSRPAVVRTAAVVALILLGIISLTVDWQSSRWMYVVGLPVIALCVSALIYVSTSGSFPGLSKALSARWLVFLGLISYSLYLWHQPVTWMLRRGPLRREGLVFTISAIAASLLAASLSYYLVELPFLRHRKRFERLGATKADVEANEVRIERLVPAEPPT